MAIEKMERYDPWYEHSKMDPEEDGAYVSYTAARAREDTLLKELKNVLANCGMPSTRESASRVIREIEESR